MKHLTMLDLMKADAVKCNARLRGEYVSDEPVFAEHDAIAERIISMAKGREFKCTDAAKWTGLSDGGARYHLQRMVESGLIVVTGMLWKAKVYREAGVDL